MEVPSCHSCVVSLRADAGISIFKLDEILSIVSRFEIIDSGIWSKTPKTGMTSLTVWDIDVLHLADVGHLKDAIVKNRNDSKQFFMPDGLHLRGKVHLNN